MSAPTDGSGQDWQGATPSGSRVADSPTSRTGPVPQQRHRNDESWVEVSSHPSSSSVSSIGDEIVTTGLRVGSTYDNRRRRLHPHYVQSNLHSQQPTYPVSDAGHLGTSSQEEYDESESEEDQVLTSSNENITSAPAATDLSSTPLQHATASRFSTRALSSEDEDSDADENATALGRRPSEPFRPQPNAFSHPPSHLAHRHSTSSAAPHHQRPVFSQRSHTRIDRHNAPNFMSPSYQADNDAALRASLTTLLSCAAAARGRPKDGETANNSSGNSSNKEFGGERAGPSSAAPAVGTQPMELRLVPESELMGEPAPQPPALSTPASSSPTRRGNPDKAKRAATPTPASGKAARATKKKKTSASAAADEAFISPTLLTWMVSAGVVVLVSVVGFGAGYVIGREVGRQESLGGLGAATSNATSAAVVEGSSNCGRDVIRSSGGTLRRFKWGAGVTGSIIA